MSDTIRCPECGHWFYLQNPITGNTDHLVRDVITETLIADCPKITARREHTWTEVEVARIPAQFKGTALRLRQ
jgi:hypothetical protein